MDKARSQLLSRQLQHLLFGTLEHLLFQLLQLEHKCAAPGVVYQQSLGHVPVCLPCTVSAQCSCAGAAMLLQPPCRVLVAETTDHYRAAAQLYCHPGDVVLEVGSSYGEDSKHPSSSCTQCIGNTVVCSCSTNAQCVVQLWQQIGASVKLCCTMQLPAVQFYGASGQPRAAGSAF